MPLVGRSSGADGLLIGGAVRLDPEHLEPSRVPIRRVAPEQLSPQDITAIIVDDQWDYGWSTEHGSALQIPRAYSMIV